MIVFLVSVFLFLWIIFYNNNFIIFIFLVFIERILMLIGLFSINVDVIRILLEIGFFSEFIFN